MPETFKQRVIRHLSAHDLDLESLANGVLQAAELFKGLREQEASLTTPHTEENFADIKDLSVTYYKMEIPQISVFSFVELARKLPIRMRIYTFPMFSRYSVHLTPEGVYTGTSEYFEAVKGARASFTGPTHNALGQETLGVPNNGFYLDGRMHEPFGVVPEGERRGAFAITKDLRMQIFDDSQKWEILNEGLDNYKAIIGCSYFFSNEDSVENHDFSVSHGKGNLSYLLTTRNARGSQRVSFFVSDDMISRFSAKRVIDDFAERAAIVSYQAVELELTHSACSVRSSNGEAETYGSGFHSRRDHYLVY